MFIHGFSKSCRYLMKKIPMNVTTKLEIEGIRGFFIKTVTKFGTSAEVDCPKEFLGRTVYLVILWSKPESSWHHFPHLNVSPMIHWDWSTTHNISAVSITTAICWGQRLQTHTSKRWAAVFNVLKPDTSAVHYDLTSSYFEGRENTTAFAGGSGKDRWRPAASPQISRPCWTWKIGICGAAVRVTSRYAVPSDCGATGLHSGAWKA